MPKDPIFIVLLIGIALGVLIFAGTMLYIAAKMGEEIERMDNDRDRIDIGPLAR